MSVRISKGGSMKPLNRSATVSRTPLCSESENISSFLCMVLYFFLSLLTAVIIYGNALVIISIIYFKQLHTPTNYLILSLAVSDLLVGIFICPFNMAFSQTACMHHLSLLCKIRGSFDVLVSASSVLNMCCISIDRYYAVCQPLQYKTKINDHVAAIMILWSWAVSVLIGVAFFLILDLEDHSKEKFLYLVLLSVLPYYLPAAILLGMYLKIFLVAKQQAQSIQNGRGQSKKSGVAASKMERKATKTLAIVTGTFMFCWTPLYLSYAFQPLSDITDLVLEPLNWLGLSNSMFNPFIYAFFYTWFRSAFRIIISGKIFNGNFSDMKLN